VTVLAGDRTVRWTWRGQAVDLGVDEAGTSSGPIVLLLPALSSISTRGEMRPLMERLATGGSFRLIAADWPGFGDRPRPTLDWSPEVYRAYLGFLLREVAPTPHAVVAAGHGATYALGQAVDDPGTIRRLALIAPTWRGPLPTMMGGPRPWFGRIRNLVDAPAIGSLAYRLNVSRFVIERMASGHVYSDKTWLARAPDRWAQKLGVTRAPGARHASVRFVTGALDPLRTRDAFLGLARQACIPLRIVYGAETPPRSRAEMEALAVVPGVDTTRLDRGKLSVHEEFPDEVSAAVMRLLER